MGQQIVGATVQGFFGHNVAARPRQILQGIAYGCRAAGCGQCCHAALQSGHALFKGVLCGVGKTVVYAVCVAEVETGLSVRTVVKNKGCRLVDGNGACARGLIWLLLPRMNLKGFSKTRFFVFVHFCPLILCSLCFVAEKIFLSKLVRNV